MRKCIFCLCLSLLLASQARAEPPSVSSIETLLAVTKADRLLDTMYGNMEQSMRQGMLAALAGRTLTPEQQRLIDNLPARFSKVMRSELSWESLKPLLVPVYLETFDQAEVDGLIAFYRSPLGQRLLDKQPLVAQKSSAAMQVLVKAVSPKFQAVILEALQQAGVK